MRRDPNHNSEASRIKESGHTNHQPARERLSFTRDNGSSGTKSSHSRQNFKTPRTEWRPVANGSQQGGTSKSVHSIASHTPSPRPQREGSCNVNVSTPVLRQTSGGGSVPSQERRSALERLSQPKERVHLLQDGVSNVVSGRLQEVNI